MVSGRRRVPCPPTSKSAFISGQNHTASNCAKIRATLQGRLNLPNALTVTRIFLVPLLVVVLLTKFEGRQIFGVHKELVAAAIFGLASLTDWLDGYLARRRKQVTAFGQVIDPLADKLLISAALISLVQLELATRWEGGVTIER